MSDDEEDEVALGGVKPAAATRLSATIDLCNDNDEDTLGAIMLVDSASSAPSSILNERHRKKKRRQMLGATTATTEIMTSDFVRPVDRNGRVDDDDDVNETRYRQALGPVRMEFLSGDWPGKAPHAFAKERSQSSSSNRRALAHELVEYQLNLPVHWSSSIFCRVVEARSDLLRVLITGA